MKNPRRRKFKSIGPKNPAAKWGFLSGRYIFGLLKNDRVRKTKNTPQTQPKSDEGTAVVSFSILYVKAMFFLAR